ncbi:MAG: sigma-70 family RNA polymerase sigma factor [Armatimonadota bacterium]|nr:sigma-70 family RNA polymerase sigma factor [Armatimonadota bacterium]
MFGIFAICGLTAAHPAEHQSVDGGSDAALIAAAQGGNADAFGTLHTRYYKRIYHLAYLKTNNAHDAEDVASETFMRALASLSRFRLKDAQTSFYPWLHRIALNLIVDSCRQRPPSGIVSLDAPVIEGMHALLDSHLSNSSLSPQEIVERHEVQQLVRSAIAALPPDQGDALIYRFLGDLSTQEIAPLLGRSEAAVKSLLHRAILALKREIERRVEAVERLEAHRDRRQPSVQREEKQHVGRA